jgi:hypothetical protein
VKSRCTGKVWVIFSKLFRCFPGLRDQAMTSSFLVFDLFSA